MKKIILSLMAITSISAMSFNFEANIKAGYDFYRSSSTITKNPYKAETKIDGRGFVVGAEVFPLQFLDEGIKLGLGAEYNFGEKTLAYGVNNENKTNKQITTFIPVYGTVKLETYKSKDTNFRLYTLLRVGYVFMKSFNETLKPIPKDATNNSGLYYGLGIGVSKDWFLAEIIYDGRFKSNGPKPNYTLDFHHKVGLRLGLQLGYSSKPEVVEKVTIIDKTETPTVINTK